MDLIDNTTIDSRLSEAIAILQFQRRTGDKFDRDEIGKESAYVDEIILKVGKRKESGQTILDGVKNIFRLSLSNPEYLVSLTPLATPEERLSFVRTYFTATPIHPGVVSKLEKNAEISRLLLNRGTELYKLRNFNGALHYYNLALMFAKKDTQSVGLAYANRAAVLVSLGHFEEAIQDIDSALQNKYPESQATKLEQRKDRCLQAIQRKEAEYSAIDPDLRKEMEAEIREMNRMRDEMLQVNKPNPLIPAAAEFVKIKHDTVMGRQLFVDRDVAAGTVIMVERPYVCTLYGQSKWDTEHCHYCLKRIWRGIPCESCVFAIYCGESCQKEASAIHQYECKCLPFLHAMDAEPEVLMAVKIILKVGSRELFRLFETKDPTYFSPRQPFGTEPNCVYDSESYLSVFHLVTNSDKLGISWQVGNAAAAHIAVTVLESQSNFFEDIPSDRKLEFKNFVAAVMTRHIDAENMNSAAITELRGLENVSFGDSFTGKIPQETLKKTMNSHGPDIFGKGIYPLYSLMNHSCDANVAVLNDKSNGTLIVMALRALNEGELLFSSYCKEFTYMRKADRHAHLTRRYHFKCVCIACEQDWPPLHELLGRNPTFCCPACSKKFFQYEKGSTEFRKCVLAAPAWKCRSCGKNYTEVCLWGAYCIAMKTAREIATLFELNRPLKAFDIFSKVFYYFQHNSCPPHYYFYGIQDTFQKIVALILHFAA